MSDHDDNLEINEQRRDVVRSLSAIAGMTALAGLVRTEMALAQDDESDLLPNGLPRSSLSAEPAVVEFDRPLDLTDPSDAWYAKIKATNNLAGVKTYVPMFSRAYICPQGQPAHPVFGHCGIWTWQLQKATTDEFEDAREGSMIQRALYTGTILDPYTFEPVETLENPYTGETITVEDSIFAMNYLLHPMGGGRDIDIAEFYNPEEKPDTPYVRFGDEVAFVLAGLFQGEGDYQPRADSSWWTTNYAQLIDPDQPLVETRYNFTGLMRAWERPWLGVEKPDQTQLLWAVEGRKVHSIDRIPDLLHKHVLSKYDDRV
ncbi:MAG: hypothetical protein OXJ63_09040 [Gammaproteobacteria bacterium]|nr:hypothetical protein [Gammaproteobacteria bacterium]